MTISELIIGKSEHTIRLCNYFINVYVQMGEITPHATKTMIAFKAHKNFAYIIRLGKNYIDIVLPFKAAYTDNLCFSKIAKVPGSADFNHHLRIFTIDDINEEVKYYMKLAYANGKGI
ncbi:DUF5655 domain-containing protein [Pedobacter sp. Du54]|uniref:DUF5655 domain-containing protein n=1 Tax=Pedobacter anseongensis TaxID=3133439 RepID=UPI0030AF075E